MARVKAAMAKAAAERAARAARTTADVATGIATTAAATGATATAATAVVAKGATVTEARTTAAEATATRETTAEKVLAEAETTAAADEWARPRDTLEPDDSHENGTAQAKRQKTAHGDRDVNERAHGHDGTARGRDDGTEDTRAEQRAGGDGDTTGGVKIRAPRVRNEEYRAAKRSRNDKYQGGKAT